MFKYLSKNTGTTRRCSSQETSLTGEFQRSLFLEVPEILGAEGVFSNSIWNTSHIIMNVAGRIISNESFCSN